MLQKNSSDLDIIRAAEPAKIRKLIRNGSIDPSVQNIQGQDLLIQALLKDMSPIQVRALLGGAKSVGKKLNIKAALQMINTESARVLGICENNLTRPRITRETKKLLSQLLCLANVSSEGRGAFSSIPVVLARAEEQKEVRVSKPKHVGHKNKIPDAPLNLAWTMV